MLSPQDETQLRRQIDRLTRSVFAPYREQIDALAKTAAGPAQERMKALTKTAMGPAQDKLSALAKTALAPYEEQMKSLATTAMAPYEQKMRDVVERTQVHIGISELRIPTLNELALNPHGTSTPVVSSWLAAHGDQLKTLGAGLQPFFHEYLAGTEESLARLAEAVGIAQIDQARVDQIFASIVRENTDASDVLAVADDTTASERRKYVALWFLIGAMAAYFSAFFPAAPNGQIPAWPQPIEVVWQEVAEQIEGFSFDPVGQELGDLPDNARKEIGRRTDQLIGWIADDESDDVDGKDDAR